MRRFAACSSASSTRRAPPNATPWIPTAETARKGMHEEFSRSRQERLRYLFRKAGHRTTGNSAWMESQRGRKQENFMVIVMQEGASEAQIQHVIDRLVAHGFNVHRSTGESHTVLGAVGVHREFDHRDFELLDGVREVMRITQPFKLASRQFRPEGTIVDLGRGVKIGGPEVVVAAGPCSVESREQIFSVAECVAKAGAKILRGGAFKPRTSPYAFQGMGEPGLKLMREAADQFRLSTVSEVMDQSQIQMMLPYVDMFQVGARNMQNYYLLRALGEVRKPVLLKRGLSATMEELLLSAEYILSGGNYNVVLCERGIRTFETYA